MLTDYPQLMDQSSSWQMPAFTPTSYSQSYPEVFSGYNQMSNFGSGYSPYTFDTPGINYGGYGGSSQWFLDTTTGQIVPGGGQAPGLINQSPLGPMAPGSQVSGFPGTGANAANAPKTVPPSRQSIFGSGEAGPINAGNIGLGAAAITSLVGLAGIIQKAVQGDERAKSEVSTRLSAASPQEQQAISLMLQQAQQGIDIQKRATDVLGPILQNMAQGNLNITPELQQTVSNIYSPLLGNIVERGMESARQRGFHGGPNEGPAAAIMAPLFSNTQGQMAQTMSEMAMGLPMSAVQGFSNLAGLNQNIVDALGKTAQVAQAPRMAQPVQTQVSTKPQQILDYLGPISSITQGVGGALGAISAMDRPQSGGAPPGYQWVLTPTMDLSGQRR